MKHGIIDLGTNTFNILIVEHFKDGSFDILLNIESPVMLGKEGINDGYISDKAFARAFNTLNDFKQSIDYYNCDRIIAFGTSAIRSASNADEFINKVDTELNIKIKSISGDQEAEYIYHGIKQSIDFTDENYLILDIGGGSNEFIIANSKELLWKHSFPLGVARLLERFKPSDPISELTINSINHYLSSELKILQEILTKYSVSKLIGASGAFDSFANILHYKKTGSALPKTTISSHISLNIFTSLYEEIINTTEKDRRLILGLGNIRIDSIVMAIIFTNFTIKLSNIDEIIHSSYSLKEGVAAIENKKLV